MHCAAPSLTRPGGTAHTFGLPLAPQSVSAQHSTAWLLCQTAPASSSHGEFQTAALQMLG